MNKALKTLCMLIVLLFSIVPSLTIATDQVVFNEIEVNDVTVTNGGMVVIERGEDLDLRVELSSPVDYDDVRVKASVEGYEYDDIEDRTDIFDMTGSTGIYTKSLNLQLPDDIDIGDYNLNIEVVNPLGFTNVVGIVLQVKEGRHTLDIQDVILRPTSTVEAGRSLGVEVRIENMGSRKEEDIKVSVSIPELGVSTRDYVNELGSEEVDSDSDETSDAVILYLPIPTDAVTGEYTLDIDVEYDRGHEVVSANEKVYVQGTAAMSDVNTIISIDAVSKVVAKNDEVSYRLMLANLGDTEAFYSLNVLGTESWADVSFNPGFVRVSPNGAGELTMTVKPREVSMEGDHSFTLQVKEGDNVLRDIQLTASVDNGKSWTSVRSVLEIGFAVLISLLVILGLIVAYKKLSNREGSEPEPMMEDTQSYY